MDLHVEHRSIPILTVKVSGRLDALGAVSLREQLEQAHADGVTRIVVDLSATEFVDSAGLAALAKGMKDARATGGDLRLVAPDSPVASRVFKLTRFDQVFAMGTSLDEMVATW